MGKQIPFQSMFDNLLSHLKASNKVVEISGNFGPDKQLSDMFAYLWKLNDIHHYIKICIDQDNKDDERAENFRKEGNIYFQRKELRKSLELYNKSIVYSSHPHNNEYATETATQLSTNLALSYSNRSAVFYELEVYDACLADISQSLYYGYPSVSKSKLIERQAKCFLLLNNKDKAKEILEAYIAEVKSMKDNELVMSDEFFKKILSLLQICSSSDEMFVKSCSKSEKTRHQKLFCRLDSIVVPELLINNPTIPAMSNALSLAYESDRGRFLTANRDIYPGEVLIREKSIGATVLPPALLSHCSFCLQRTFSPVPCAKCCSVVFCCDDCKMKALKHFHGTECKLLPTLAALEIGKNAVLALRLVIQLTLPELREKIHIYDQEKALRKGAEIGFNEFNIYSSDDFRTIYHLVTNQEKRTVSDLFKRGVMAVCLVKLLLETDYFDGSAEVNILLVGKTVFTLLMSLPCNAHSITELRINPKNCQESHMEEIGAGAFGVLSLTNHSCNPTVSRSSYCSTVIARAIQFIAKGAEITDSYGQHFAIQNTEERRHELRQQYYFSCCCEACVDNWPQYSELSDEIFLICPKCAAKVKPLIGRCTKCDTTIFDLHYKSTSLESICSSVTQAVETFKNFHATVFQEPSCEKHEKDIINIIYLLCLYVNLPIKTLLEAQETLKFCFDRKASHYYTY